MTTGEREVEWRALSNELARHARGLHMLKAELATSLPSALDQAAVGLLHYLAINGPCRQGELAENVHLDPSTVSRHVAQLVRAGYAERMIDPDDGRVVRLHPTAQGQELCRNFADRRHAVISGIMADWADQDVRELTKLLARLNNDIEALRSRVATSVRSTKSTLPQEN